MITAALLIAFAILQAADIYTTWRLVSTGGRELNKRMRYFINRLGLLPGLIVPKAAVTAALAGVILLCEWTARKFYWHWAGPLAMGVEYLLLIGALALYAWVVWHNWRQLHP